MSGRNSAVRWFSDGEYLIEYLEQEQLFLELKRRHLRFVILVGIVCFVWYLTYVLLVAFAQELLATPVCDSIDLGSVLTWANIAFTSGIAILYASFAKRVLEPLSAEIQRRAVEYESSEPNQ